MAGKKKNPNNRRQNVPHASLQKRYNTRIRQEYIDQDYVEKLDDTVKNCTFPDGTPCTEMEYLSQFMKEWNNAGVKKQSEAKDNKFHRTAAEAKECTDRNNARNRDQLSIEKAKNMIHKQDYEVIQDWLEEKKEISTNYTEDALIAILDETKNLGSTTDDTDNDT